MAYNLPNNWTHDKIEERLEWQRKQIIDGRCNLNHCEHCKWKYPHIDCLNMDFANIGYPNCCSCNFDLATQLRG